MISLDSDPAGLESIREMVLHSVARFDIEVSIVEPLAITGRIHFDREGHFTRRAMGNGHVPLVIETNQERI